MKDAADIGGVATVVQRLAVLLAGGVAPASAWAHLQQEGLPARVADAVAGGNSCSAAILRELEAVPPGEQAGWRGLATAWTVATDAGAPLASTLREFAGSLRSLAQARREISVALAAPIATARMVMVLPFVGVLLGAALGFNSLATLFTTPVGLGLLVTGAMLMLLASRWSGTLVAAAQPVDLTPGLEFDLTAIAVSGGASFDRAQASVNSAMQSCGLDRHDSDGGVDEVLALSRRAGVPAAELLRSEAELRRLEARAEMQERAATLSVRLMMPLGLCILPAFVVLGVLPLLVTVLTSSGF